MDKKILTIILAAAAVSAASAQTVVDALQLTQSDVRGSARYMGMGGAFTALGGDISAFKQNPAGVGIFRSSEVSATLDIDMQKTQGPGLAAVSQTKAMCNNFGYVGSVKLDSPVLYNLNWAVSYNRNASFDRHTTGYALPTGTSLSNYIASFTYLPTDAYKSTDTYNPYFDPYILDGETYYPDWLSVLGAQSHMINRNRNGQWQGMFQNGTTGDSYINVSESGYSDEYLINFGGNFQDMVYWGIGIGINDLKYTRYTEYSESMENALVYNQYSGGTAVGNAGFWLDNYKRISGTGYNFSFGLIVKPINEFRIGASIKSPTYWKLHHEYDAAVDFSYFVPSEPESLNNPYASNAVTEWSAFDWKLRSPWRFNVGAAAVIGAKAIISVDYERQAYSDMNVKNAWYDNWGYNAGYEQNDYANQSINDVAQSANSIRVGAEYRVTPSISVRAGYNYTGSNVKSMAADGDMEVPTSGTDPSYSVAKSRNALSLGLGYRIKSFYVDAAYVYTKRDATLSPYTSFATGSDLSVWNEAPRMDIKDHTNSLVFTIGLKF